MDPVPPTPPAPPRRSWGRIALVGALVLSVIGNALALGAFYRLNETRKAYLGPYATSVQLPDELRREIRRALRAKTRELLPLLRDLGQERTAVLTALQAEPFDAAAADAAMTGFRSALDTLLSSAQVVILDRMQARAGN